MKLDEIEVLRPDAGLVVGSAGSAFDGAGATTIRVGTGDEHRRTDVKGLGVREAVQCVLGHEEDRGGPVPDRRAHRHGQRICDRPGPEDVLGGD